MNLAGKTAPTYEELGKIPDEFDYIEVYTEREHVEDEKSLRDSIDTLKNSDYEPVSVHIPHIVKNDDLMPDWQKYLENTDKIAEEFDALTVFDSPYTPQTHYAGTEDDFDPESDLAFEHQAGISCEAIRNNILNNPNTDEDYGFVFDTAHIFVATPSSYKEKTEEYANHPQTELIHFNDAVPQQDGKTFSEGDMDTQEIYGIIAESDFEGSVILEFMPEDQEEALDKVKEWEEERLESVESREVD